MAHSASVRYLAPWVPICRYFTANIPLFSAHIRGSSSPDSLASQRTKAFKFCKTMPATDWHC
eukprot:856597-Rhodomonas_salina.1